MSIKSEQSSTGQWQGTTTKKNWTTLKAKLKCHRQWQAVGQMGPRAQREMKARRGPLPLSDHQTIKLIPVFQFMKQANLARLSAALEMQS